jgi:hypothetical protein
MSIIGNTKDIVANDLQRNSTMTPTICKHVNIFLLDGRIYNKNKYSIKSKKLEIIND